MVLRFSSLFILFAVLSGCAQSSEIRIGVVAPLTGPASAYGIPSVNAIILASEEINNGGGINGRPIRLIIEDGGCDGKIASTIANKMINIDRVDVLMTGCSGESMSVAPIANDHRLIQWAFLTSARDYTLAGEYSFRNFPSTEFYASEMARLASAQGSRTVAILAENTDFAISVTDSFADEFLVSGGKIGFSQTFEKDEQDFRSMILKIEDSNVDTIIFQTQGEGSATAFYRQMREADLMGKYSIYTTTSAGFTKSVHEQSGGLESVTALDLYADPSTDQAMDFLRKYEERFQTQPKTTFFYVAGAYDSLYVIVDGLSQCGHADSACLKIFFENMEPRKGLSGLLSLDENGDGVAHLALHSFNADGSENWIAIS